MLEKAKEILEQVKENKSKFFLPLDIQRFAGEDGGDGGTDGGADGGAGAGTGDEGDEGNKTGDDGGQGSKDGKTGDSKHTKTFTQDDVNNLVAREAKKATEKLLKQLGVTDFKTAKEGLDKFKEIQDSQKTDAQKAVEKAKQLEDTNLDLTKQVSTLNAQLAALKADVNPDSLNDVIVLANNLVNDDTDIDAAIKQVLTKYPNFKRTSTNADSGEGSKKPKFSKGDHDNNGANVTETDKWINAFKFGQ